MRTGGNTFKDGVAEPEDGLRPFDWVNLPPGVVTLSLWDSLHDANVVSIRSDLLARTVTFTFENEPLRSFHQYDDEFQFVLNLEGVQSARVLRYEIWPGGCSIPSGIPREEERKLVEQYQAKWREESASWSEFEARVSRVDEQVFDISDAALAFSGDRPTSLKLCGHLNYATYHEVYLRFETLQIFGSDRRVLDLREFQRLGEAYWTAFSKRAESKT